MAKLKTVKDDSLSLECPECGSEIFINRKNGEFEVFHKKNDAQNQDENSEKENEEKSIENFERDNEEDDDGYWF